jgi:hypothetical protein
MTSRFVNDGALVQRDVASTSVDFIWQIAERIVVDARGQLPFNLKRKKPPHPLFQRKELRSFEATS